MDEKILNKKQLEAIQHKDGPLLIIAGAGTGKTTVITERIKWLITKELAKPTEILALTFTEKAALEMLERVDVSLPLGLPQMWISTFHAFCDRILKDEAVYIGLDSGYRIITEAEAIAFLKKHLFELNLEYFRPLGNPTKFITGLLQHFSRLKDEDITSDDYAVWLQKKKSKEQDQEEVKKLTELSSAYKVYGQLKAKEGVMDFADLISNTLALFRSRKNVLTQYRDQFKYVLVDEFQDTNIAQNELVILLSGKDSNITAVADDDQSIYRFRGAAVSNVIQFKQQFPKAKIVVLTQNYRSTQEILDKAYLLIQNNNPDRLEIKEEIDKKLESMRKIKGQAITFIYKDRVENEAEAVANKILEIIKKYKRPKSGKNYTYKDFAILVRAHNHSQSFTQALQRLGIPYQFLGKGQLFRQSEVKDLIAYLKVLNDFQDNVAFYRVLTMEHWQFFARDLAALISFVKKYNLSLFEACEICTNKWKSGLEDGVKEVNNIVSIPKRGNFILPFVRQESKALVIRITEMVLRHLELVSRQSAGQILFYFLKDSGLLKTLTAYDTQKKEQQAQNIAKFFDKLKAFEVEHEDARIATVVEWIDLSMELGESPQAADFDWIDNNAVNILTVHAAKGLEFPIVFLVNLVAARFPSLQRREQIPIPQELIKEVLPEGDYHLEEERRLFYVGMTRAKDLLYLTAANYYGEGKREKKLSPFLYEALEKEKFKTEKEGQQLSLLLWQEVQEFPETTKQGFKIDYLSYSQINTFSTCPLQYKYRYILSIPAPPSAAMVFGQIMHKVLQLFYQQVKLGKKPQKRDLLLLYEENWNGEGFLSKAHERRMKDKGEQILNAFFNNFYSEEIIPKDLEKAFSIRINNYVKVVGRIDRVDEYEDGKVEIIDYKTGRLPQKKKLDKDLQLTIYALAASSKYIYAKDPDDLILSFYFLDEGKKLSTKRNKQDLEEAKSIIIQKAEEIVRSPFLPTPGPWCGFCDFKLICEAWQ